MILQLGIPMSTQERLRARAEKAHQSLENCIEELILQIVDSTYDFEEWRKKNMEKRQLCEGNCSTMHFYHKENTLGIDEVEFHDVHSEICLN